MTPGCMLNVLSDQTWTSPARIWQPALSLLPPPPRTAKRTPTASGHARTASSGSSGKVRSPSVHDHPATNGRLTDASRTPMTCGLFVLDNADIGRPAAAGGRTGARPTAHDGAGPVGGAHADSLALRNKLINNGHSNSSINNRHGNRAARHVPTGFAERERCCCNGFRSDRHQVARGLAEQACGARPRLPAGSVPDGRRERQRRQRRRGPAHLKALRKAGRETNGGRTRSVKGAGSTNCEALPSCPPTLQPFSSAFALPLPSAVYSFLCCTKT